MSFQSIRAARLVLPALLFCLVLPRGAQAQSCEHEARRTGTASLSGVERVLVGSGAGSLEVVGRPGATGASADGRACASEERDLDQLRLDVRREGATLVIEALYPDDRIHVGNRYARIDLIVQLPEGTAIRVEDGSGDMSVAGVGEADLRDGSGGIVARDIRGELRIDDGSGDIEVSDAFASVDITDGSGEIDIRDARGSVRIDDGSGNTRVHGVGGSVRVEDGSGELRISEVTRDVVIDDDGSGSIRVERVGGDFTVDDDGSGGLSYSDVRGRVSVPRDD